MAPQAPNLLIDIPRRAFGARELVDMTGVSERRVRTAMKTGEIQTVRVFGRVLIPANEVDRLLTPAMQPEGGPQCR